MTLIFLCQKIKRMINQAAECAMILTGKLKNKHLNILTVPTEARLEHKLQLKDTMHMEKYSKTKEITKAPTNNTK